MMFALLLRVEWYNFLHSPGWTRLAIFLNLKNLQIWQLQWSAIHSKYKFCFLSQSSKCQSLVIKSFKTCEAINLRIRIFFWEQYILSHNDVCKVSFLRNSHEVWLYMLMKYRLLKIFTKIVSIISVLFHDVFYHVFEIFSFWSEKCAV